MADDPKRLDPGFWRETLAPYAKPDVGRATLDVTTSVVPYLALIALMYAVRSVSLPLVLVLAVPAAGFLVRTFIVFHDCAHGSFLPWRRANTWLGVVCGLLVYSPFHSWRHEHAVHHATAGDLDRRGRGGRDARGRGWHLGVLRPAPVPGRLLGTQGALELRGLGAARQLPPSPTETTAVLHREHRSAPRPPPQRRHPHYNLQRAHDENPVFHAAPELDLRDAVLAFRLKLYDERTGRLVGFSQVA